MAGATVHGNEWYDHAVERGGHAISFVQNFYGLTYPEAVTRLLNGEQGEVYVPAEKKEKEPPKEFALPPSNQAMRRVYAYLLQQRHISREVLSAFAQKGLIYESRELSIDQTKVYHNAVFVGFDERGVARHAHKRGLYILKNRADEIAMQFQSVLAKNNCQGIRTQAEKKEVASAWLELAISCAKVPVKYEADEIKRRQKEEKTQREAEPVMA